MYASSDSKVSPSSTLAKYPRERPQSAIVPATRPTICLTEFSRVGEPSWPRKYFWATMFVAFWLQDFGNSTSRCSKATRSPWAMRASRRSHSIVSKACCPGVVKKRLTERASPGVVSVRNGVCELPSIDLLLSSPRAVARTFGGLFGALPPLLGLRILCLASDGTTRGAVLTPTRAQTSTG